MNHVIFFRKTVAVFCLLFFSSLSFLSAQKTIIQGQVLLDENENAYGALISLQDSLQQVVNENGEFFFELNDPLLSVKFSISFLGYENLDTIILLNDASNISKFDFTLEKKAFGIPEIIVTDEKELNLFEKTNWTILDMVLYEESFFLIAIDKRRRYLFQYDKEGFFVEKVEMKKINSFVVSCLGSLYVKSNAGCFQLSVEEEIEIVAELTLSKFDEQLKPCVAYYESKMVYEFLSHHNKRKKYVKIWDKGKRKTIASIVDKKAEKVSRSYYYEILGAYGRAIEFPSGNEINAGVGQPNIIKNGSWKGDLKELIINNELHGKVSYYLNVESKPIQVLNFFYQEKLYLLDYVNQEFLSFDAKNDFVKEKIDSNFDWNVQLKLLNVQQGETVYFYSKDDIYKLNTSKESTQIFNFFSIPNDLYYKQIVGADSNFVYVVGRKDISIPKMVVKKYRLN